MHGLGFSVSGRLCSLNSSSRDDGIEMIAGCIPAITGSWLRSENGGRDIGLLEYFQYLHIKRRPK
jgi:hypothetical protein